MGANNGTILSKSYMYVTLIDYYKSGKLSLSHDYLFFHLSVLEAGINSALDVVHLTWNGKNLVGFFLDSFFLP